MRPVKQAGVVSTHTLLFFAPVAAGLTVGASLQLLHVTREAFLFVSACMLAYSVRDLPGIDHRTFWRRRFALVAVPYLCWTVIYFLVGLPSEHGTPRADTIHLLYLFGTGYYQLYYLLVLLEFYALFPLLLVLLRKTAGHHGLVLLVSGLVQMVLVSSMHWGLLPSWMQGYWATREVTSYQFYLVAGMVVAMHLDEFHDWLCAHVLLIVAGTLAAAVAAEVWYYLAADHVLSWLGSSADPFQPIVIPFNVGAIACIYLIGVALVHRRRSKRTRAMVQSGSDNSYGIYLAQVLLITIMSWLGWQHLNEYPALAAGCRDHGGGRLRVLYRPDGVAGPHAAGQAPDRPDQSPVVSQRRGDGRPAWSPRGRMGSTAPTPVRCRRLRCRVSRRRLRRWRRQSPGSRHRRGGGCARAAARCT